MKFLNLKSVPFLKEIEGKSVEKNGIIKILWQGEDKLGFKSISQFLEKAFD